MPKHQSLTMDAKKRHRLFDVAMAEFVSHGFAQASLNRIIKEAGISKSSFYHYFANKTELFNQVVEQSSEPITDIWTHLDLNALVKTNFWQSLFDAGQSAVAVLVNDPQIIMVGRMFWKSRDHIEKHGLMTDFTETMKPFFLKILKRGQELGEIRTDLPESLLISATIGLGMAVDQWMVDHFDALDADELVQINKQSMDMMVRLLSTKG